MRLIDITGSRYGRLLVTGKHPAPAKNGGSLWDCVCDCGNRKTLNGSNLRNGSVQSCGCLAREWAAHMGSNPDFIAKRAEKTVTHGNKRRSGASVEYKTWLGMKRRCYDAKSKDYPNWGGRGIRVCEHWNSSFESFLADMGPRPAGHYSIDRINPNAHYSPGNCRWATLQQQGAENTRTNRKITHLGIDYQSLAAACRALNIPLSRAQMRVNAGMPMDKVLSQNKLSRWDSK